MRFRTEKPLFIDPFVIMVDTCSYLQIYLQTRMMLLCRGNWLLLGCEVTSYASTVELRYNRLSYSVYSVIKYCNVRSRVMHYIGWYYI